MTDEDCLKELEEFQEIDRAERFFYDKNYDRLAEIFGVKVEDVKLGFSLGIKYQKSLSTQGKSASPQQG